MAVAGGEVLEKLDDMIVRQAESTGVQVAAAQHRDQRLFDHFLLAEDHRPDGGLGRGNVLRGRFRRPDDHVLELFDPFSACCSHL